MTPTVEDHERTRKIIEHVKKNRVATNKKRRKCVDGGYAKEQAPGAVARAGGDLGYSEALLRLKKLRPELRLTVRETFDFVNDFVQSRGEKYGWHSDSHSAPEGHAHGHETPVIGCGHCLRAIKHAADFGVDARDVEELVQIVSQAENTDFINLDRSHAEKAVLVITSSKYTVNHWDKEQYFVYNAANDDEFLRTFVPFLNNKLQGRGKVTYQELKDALKAQLDVTLGLLAGELPLYTVDPTNENTPAVKFIQYIQPYKAAA